jgi:hypothetical protein
VVLLGCAVNESVVSLAEPHHIERAPVILVMPLDLTATGLVGHGAGATLKTTSLERPEDGLVRPVLLGVSSAVLTLVLSDCLGAGGPILTRPLGVGSTPAVGGCVLAHRLASAFGVGGHVPALCFTSTLATLANSVDTDDSQLMPVLAVGARFSSVHLISPVM